MQSRRFARRQRFWVGLSLALVIGLLLSATVALASPPDHASHQHGYDGPYFGENNFPPGCTRDRSRDNPENFCFRMFDVSYLNPIDSPQIDVLVLVPASPAAERDMRIMRQSVEMWEAGIKYLARQMGLDWLAEGVDFHIFIDAVDLTGGDGGEFTTYPIVDPEIVMVVANPGSGAGIGVSAAQTPCHGLANPFDLEYWENLPGFNSHHDSRSGTYSEECGGSGGNTCFAVVAGWDPEPVTIEWWSLFNIMSHEFGHCLSLGHVGDGAEALLGNAWGPVTLPDIMSYSDDATLSVGNKLLTKCVSTLDVELFATRMSRYLDVNGDGVVGPDDVLTPNDVGRRFQVQHPADHLYASSTGSPRDCPQADLGLLPGPRTDWTPDPVPSLEAVLDVTSPVAGTTTDRSTVVVEGTVRERSLLEPEAPPTTVTYEDDPADATGVFTEIESVTVTATESHVEAVIDLSRIWPSLYVKSPVVYTLTIGGRPLSSFVDYQPTCTPCAPTLGSPRTNDGWNWLPEGTSEWDLENNRVLFHVPREYLRQFGIRAPYEVSVSANHGRRLVVIPDDWAPAQGETITLGAPPQDLPEPPPVGDPSDDDDQDGVPNASDRCPSQPGLTADGCTAQTPSRIEVSVDGVLAGAQDVYAGYGPDDFAIPVELARGSHSQTVRVEWLDAGTVLASRELVVTRRRGRSCERPPGGADAARCR